MINEGDFFWSALRIVVECENISGSLRQCCVGLSTNILNSNIYSNIKKRKDSIVKINIPLWKKTHQRLLCKWAHSMVGQGQVTGVALVPRHSLLKVRRDMVWTPSNLKSPVWKYFGFWSVDGKNAEPQVVCNLCKLQSAYHSTTSNMRAHPENVHPNEHAMMSPTKTATSQWFFTTSHKLFVCSTTRGMHEETCFVHGQGYEADQYHWWHRLQRVLSRTGTEVTYLENK